MPGKKSKRGWGKGRRSSSRIGRRHKNKFWKKKADIYVLPDKHVDDGGYKEHMSVATQSDTEEKEEEISSEVSEELEAEMDDSPEEIDAVSSYRVAKQQDDSKHVNSTSYCTVQSVRAHTYVK